MQAWQRSLVALANRLAKNLLVEKGTYEAAVRSCEKASEWAWALHLLVNASRNSAAPGVAVSTFIANAACRRAKWKQAVSLLASLHQPDRVAFNILITAWGLGQHWEQSLAVFEDMLLRNVSRDVVTFASVGATCSRSSQWELACHIFQGMGLQQVKHNKVSYGALMSAFEKGMQWTAALAVFGAIPKALMSPVTFNSAMSACAKSTRWQHSIAMFASFGSLRTLVSFNAAIHAYGAASKWQHAILTLESLRAAHLKPDAISFTSAIDACGESSRWENALSLMKCAGTIGVDLDVACMSAVMTACAKGHEWIHALVFLDQMRDRLLDPAGSCVNAVVAACNKGSQWERSLSLNSLLGGVRAEFVFADAKIAHDMIDDTSSNIIAVNNQITACVRGALWERALHLVALADRPDHVTFTAAAEVLAASQRPREELLALYRGAMDKAAISHWHPKEHGVLDLHGFNVELAEAAVLSELLNHLLRPTPSSFGRHLVVVVGRGNNSAGGVARIGPALMEMLNVEFSKNDLVGEAKWISPGRILVPLAGRRS